MVALVKNEKIDLLHLHHNEVFQIEVWGAEQLLKGNNCVRHDSCLTDGL